MGQARRIEHIHPLKRGRRQLRSMGGGLSRGRGATTPRAAGGSTQRAPNHDTARDQVSITAVSDLDFGTMMKSTVGRKKLLAYARSEFSDENLLFWADVQSYKSADAASVAALGAAIIDKYICAGGQMEVNLSSEARQPFRTQGGYDYAPNLFDEAEREIIEMLKKDTFSRCAEKDSNWRRLPAASSSLLLHLSLSAASPPLALTAARCRFDLAFDS